MQRLTIFVLVLTFTLLSACASGTETPVAESAAESIAPLLLISGGQINKSFTRADLEALPATEAVFNDIAYKGVTVVELVQAAGFDPAQVKAIKAVASDGFTVNYDTNQVLVDGVIVAYARTDGALNADDGDFRMVLPGAEGKLNVRKLVEVKVIN